MKWLKHFVAFGEDPTKVGKKPAFKCQDPRDTQTRYMRYYIYINKRYKRAYFIKYDT